MKINFSSNGLEGIEIIIEIIESNEEDLVDLSIKYDNERINTVCLTKKQFINFIGLCKHVKSKMNK